MGIFDNLDLNKKYEPRQDFKPVDPIPEGTKFDFVVEKVEKIEPNGTYPDGVLRMILNVTGPEEYKGRTINHNLKIYSKDQSIANDAYVMVARYDQNGNKIILGADALDKDWWNDIAFINKALVGVKGIANARVYVMDVPDRDRNGAQRRDENGNPKMTTITGNYVDYIWPVGTIFKEKSTVNQDVSDDDIPY